MSKNEGKNSIENQWKTKLNKSNNCLVLTFSLTSSLPLFLSLFSLSNQEPPTHGNTQSGNRHTAYSSNKLSHVSSFLSLFHSLSLSGEKHDEERERESQRGIEFSHGEMKWTNSITQSNWMSGHQQRGEKRREEEKKSEREERETNWLPDYAFLPIERPHLELVWHTSRTRTLAYIQIPLSVSLLIFSLLPVSLSLSLFVLSLSLFLYFLSLSLWIHIECWTPCFMIDCITPTIILCFLMMTINKIW